MERDSLIEQPFHPDRDGCDCEKRGLMDEEECVHHDPCWTSREAYLKSLPPKGVEAVVSKLRQRDSLGGAAPQLLGGNEAQAVADALEAATALARTWFASGFWGKPHVPDAVALREALQKLGEDRV